MNENHIVSSVAFIDPSKLNEHFAILRRNMGDNLVIRRYGDLLQFSTSNDGYIVEMTIQPNIDGGARIFKFDPWNYDIITSAGKDILKFMGKFKDTDLLMIQLVEVDYKRYNIVVMVNGIERMFDAEIYEPREHCEWAYGIDAWLGADIRRDIGGVTETTHFYFADAAKRDNSVYARFGKRLKTGLKVAGKNEPREFLNGTGLMIDNHGKAVAVNTDGHLIFVTPFEARKTNILCDTKFITPDIEVFLGNKATKALGDILTNKVLLGKRSTPEVAVNPDFLEKIPHLTRFASIERMSETEEIDHYSPLAFKCTMIKSKDMAGAAVFSFTSPTPLLTHFRFLVRQEHSFKYPDLTELMKNSLTLNDEEAKRIAFINKAELAGIIERLDNEDALYILSKDGELHIDAIGRTTFPEDSVLKSYDFVEDGYFAWPENKIIRVSVEVMRKILAVLQTDCIWIVPMFKEGVDTFYVADTAVKPTAYVAAMPVRR